MEAINSIVVSRFFPAAASSASGLVWAFLGKSVLVMLGDKLKHPYSSLKNKKERRAVPGTPEDDYCTKCRVRLQRTSRTTLVTASAKRASLSLAASARGNGPRSASIEKYTTSGRPTMFSRGTNPQ
jgi:hypothetical protein